MKKWAKAFGETLQRHLDTRKSIAFDAGAFDLGRVDAAVHSTAALVAIGLYVLFSFPSSIRRHVPKHIVEQVCRGAF